MDSRYQVSDDYDGREALRGEDESTLAIHKIFADFTPEPMAYGSFNSVPDLHYSICKFYKLAEGLPEPSQFCTRTAALHNKSISPNGKVGFCVITYFRDLPQKNAYTDTWEECFTNGFRHMLGLNHERGN